MKKKIRELFPLLNTFDVVQMMFHRNVYFIPQYGFASLADFFNSQKLIAREKKCFKAFFGDFIKLLIEWNSALGSVLTANKLCDFNCHKYFLLHQEKF